MEVPKATDKQLELLKKYHINYKAGINISEASILISAFQRTVRLTNRSHSMYNQVRFGEKIKEKRTKQ